MKIGRNLFTLSAALLIGACTGPTKPADQPDSGGSNDMRAGGDDGGGGDGGGDPSATFTGKSASVFVSESADVEEPDDFSTAPVTALVPGSTVTYPAETHPDGTFTIPGLPAGAAWIRQGSDRYIYTKSRSIDLRQYQLGRPDRVQATDSIPVSMSFTGMAPWADLDDFQLTVANVGFVDTPLQYAPDLPALGATSVSNATFDWMDVSTPWLISPAKGDQAIFSQLSTQVVGDVTYLTLSRSATLPTFSVAQGAPVNVNLAMVSTAPQQSLTINWKRSRFEALRTAVFPTAQSFAQDGTVSANPGGSRAELGDIPDLLRVQPDLGATDLALGSLSYRNPFPAGWTVYGRFTQMYRISYALPGVARNGTLVAAISVSDTTDKLGSGDITPVVGPVINLKVNGNAAQSNVSGVGTTPLLSWEPSSVGAPNGYIVTLYRLEPIPDQQFPRSTRVATLYTTESSIVLPKDLMASGQNYCFLVRAVSQPGVDVSKTPYLVPMKRSYADALTAIVSP